MKIDALDSHYTPMKIDSLDSHFLPVFHSISTSNKLATQGTQDEEKQNKKTTQ
jgi:hypothetical protein